MKRLHDSSLAAAPKRRPRKANRHEEPTARIAEEAFQAVSSVLQDLPQADNSPGAVEHMLRANGILRNLPSPAPFDRTTHRLHLGDARDLSWVADGSVHLVVTSPPYWTLKEYEHTAEQLGDVEDYEQFLAGVYEGMIIGENARNDDMPVNPCRAKKLSNMRSTGDGKGVILFPPFTMTLGAPSNTSPPTNTWRSRPRASACAKRSSTPTAANAPG